MRSDIILKHIASAVVLGIFLSLALGSAEDSNVEEKVSNTKEPVKELTPQELNEQLKKELAAFNKPFDNKLYDGTLEALQMEIVIFGIWADIINRGELSTLEENVKLAQELKNKVTALQVKEFPILRQKYGKIIAEKMWEFDITARTIGAGNSILDFTGATFAANKNIKEYQITLQDALTLFRFKQTRYRWYKGADEYTYFKLETPADKELILPTD
jgi:hypothetical protein